MVVKLFFGPKIADAVSKARMGQTPLMATGAGRAVQRPTRSPMRPLHGLDAVLATASSDAAATMRLFLDRNANVDFKDE